MCDYLDMSLDRSLAMRVQINGTSKDSPVVLEASFVRGMTFMYFHQTANLSCLNWHEFGRLICPLL